MTTTTTTDTHTASSLTQDAAEHLDAAHAALRRAYTNAVTQEQNAAAALIFGLLEPVTTLLRQTQNTAIALRADDEVRSAARLRAHDAGYSAGYDDAQDAKPYSPGGDDVRYNVSRRIARSLAKRTPAHDDAIAEAVQEENARAKAHADSCLRQEVKDRLNQ